jgi:hypothetical protein
MVENVLTLAIVLTLVSFATWLLLDGVARLSFEWNLWRARREVMRRV